MHGNSATLIAEIGCNHRGEMETARELIRIAAVYCGVEAVKFQKRDVRALLSPEQYDAPHPNPANSYGNTYGAHREFLEFDADQHRQLKSWCDEFDVEYGCSVWDLQSARTIIGLHPNSIKIPSACNTDYPMLEWIANNHAGEIQVSVGMTTRDEEATIVNLFANAGRAHDLVVLSCTSGYPVPFEDVCLLEIERLQEAWGSTVKSIGFSGHHLGIAVDIAALTLGAKVIERHFTLDRTWKGTDHAASLEPEGMRRLHRDLAAVSSALTRKSDEILDIEAVQRAKLKPERIPA
jgi:sialic acid synthase